VIDTGARGRGIDTKAAHVAPGDWGVVRRCCLGRLRSAADVPVQGVPVQQETVIPAKAGTQAVKARGLHSPLTYFTVILA